MAEFRVRWPDLKGGVTLQTGQTHRIIIERVPVDRLELEDKYFNIGSAVLLPDVPATNSSGDTQAVEFSDEDLWKELASSHEAFTKTVRDTPFDPETDGDGISRHAGLGVLITALRFLDQNQDRRLLIAGHTDRSGDDDHNLRLSEARARGVLAVLEGNRDAFVKACHDFHADEDDTVILRYMTSEHGWACDPGAEGKPSHQAIQAFQKTYNDRFSGSIAVDGIVGDETRGAYFDVYQNDLASMAGGQADLGTLRAKIRFVTTQKKFLACGERYPIENPAKDGYRSQRNRRVELLFFEPPHFPDPADERTPDLIYKRKLFRFEVLDRGHLPRPIPSSDGANGESVTIVDAPSPEPGVGDSEEPLETQMASLGEGDSADLWAFLEPFESAQPAVGRQSVDEPFVPGGGVLV